MAKHKITKCRSQLGAAMRIFFFFGEICSSQNLQREDLTLASTMRKSRSTAFRICVTYRGPDDFWPSYRRSKSADGGKSESVTEIMRCLKKSHGHNLQNWASVSNQRQTNPLGSTLIRYGGSILQIVAVTFFLNTSSLLQFFFEIWVDFGVP